MILAKWPYCNLEQCNLHHKCQSEQSIIMRILRDNEESKDFFKSCQKITHWSIANGYKTPHTNGN